MKKIQIRKPDVKGAVHKLKNLKKEDVKAYWTAKRERRARILEERKNSAKKAGEEAGTKLLLPMMMMLCIVMVLIMIPAYFTI